MYVGPVYPHILVVSPVGSFLFHEALPSIRLIVLFPCKTFFIVMAWFCFCGEQPL